MDIIENVMLTVRAVSNLFQNCFYTVKDPVTSTNIRRDFSIAIFFWNIMYNFGYFYSDIKNIIFFFTGSGAPLPGTNTQWQSFGHWVGDILMRLLYSRYYPRGQLIFRLPSISETL